jgi:hypothetical protein
VKGSSTPRLGKEDVRHILLSCPKQESADWNLCLKERLAVNELIEKQNTSKKMRKIFIHNKA